MHPSLEHSGNSQCIRFLFLKRTLDWKLQHTPESPAEAVAARRVKFQRVEQSRWNEKQDSTEVQTSEQGHAHLVCYHSLHKDFLQGEQLEVITAAKSHGRARVVKFRALPAPRRRWRPSPATARAWPRVTGLVTGLAASDMNKL